MSTGPRETCRKPVVGECDCGRELDGHIVIRRAAVEGQSGISLRCRECGGTLFARFDDGRHSHRPAPDWFVPLAERGRVVEDFQGED
jgi:hypothetical protein